MVQFLEITLPGFRWLSPGTFVLGLGSGPCGRREEAL
jgi:hypothetical protein